MNSRSAGDSGIGGRLDTIDEANRMIPRSTSGHRPVNRSEVVVRTQLHPPAGGAGIEHTLLGYLQGVDAAAERRVIADHAQ